MHRNAIALLACAFCVGCFESAGDGQGIDLPATSASSTSASSTPASDPPVAAANTVARPFPAGLYGNVCMSQMTGDLGGFEVRFFEDAGTPMAEFVLCEGWCNETFVSELIRDGAGFRFSNIEELQGAQVTRHIVEYQVSREGEGYRLKSWYDGKELPWGEGALLAPLSAPSGITVVKREEEWSAPACGG